MENKEENDPMILGDFVKKYDYNKQFNIVAGISISLGILLLVIDYLCR